jgi:transcriptional regulator with GAF, ATPase, and Fis domain
VNAKLISIAGPLNGATLTVTEGMSIGRAPENTISIDDPQVSRRHCLIGSTGGKHTISDLESLNGTFVNGLPIKERLLEANDQIRIGSSLFLFLPNENESATLPPQAQLDEGRSVVRNAVQRRLEDTLYCHPENSEAVFAPAGRPVQELKALLRISAAISSVRGLEPLQRSLLEWIFELVPVKRGAIILLRNGVDEFASIFGWDRMSGLNRPVQVSRAAIDRALRERVAVLSNEVEQRESSGTEVNPPSSSIGSLLAVPLLLQERLIGAIYLDTDDPAVRLTQEHLQLVTAIAGMAALALDNARRLEWLEAETRRLQAEIEIEHNMVGDGRKMREIYHFISKVAPTDSTVLICGESGTGKELVARAVHRNSRRAAKPFVAINCAALAETLLESELFGHEKGSFTGAIAQKRGKLEVADGGTVFLDEVAELAPTLQAKLLRVLQEREFERVGGTRPIRVDLRVIAATNRDLLQAIKTGLFRQDLYFRLNVVSLTMPPLRDRREDIPSLASYFAAKYSAKSRRGVVGLSPEARTSLMDYEWPGNVRELENAIERAVIMSSTDVILPEDLPEAVLDSQVSSSAVATRYHEAIKQAKRQVILKALEEKKGIYTEAAKSLGVHPNYLHRLIRVLDLRSELKVGARSSPRDAHDTSQFID